MLFVIVALFVVYRQPRLWNAVMLVIFLVAHMFVPTMTVLPVAASAIYVALSVLVAFTSRLEVAIVTVVLLETLAVWRTNAVVPGVMCLVVLMVHTVYLLTVLISPMERTALPRKA